MMTERMKWIGVACVALGLLVTGARPTLAAEGRKPDPKAPPKPSAPAPDPKSVAAVNAAAAALVKEAQAAMKEKGGGKLREKCDYFGAKPPAEITPEAVLA